MEGRSGSHSTRPSSLFKIFHCLHNPFNVSKSIPWTKAEISNWILTSKNKFWSRKKMVSVSMCECEKLTESWNILFPSCGNLNWVKRETNRICNQCLIEGWLLIDGFWALFRLDCRSIQFKSVVSPDGSE